MILFDFECAEHGIAEDILVKNRDETVECPECGEPMKRIISGTSYHQSIQDYLESCGRPCSSKDVPKPPKRWV